MKKDWTCTNCGECATWENCGELPKVCWKCGSNSCRIIYRKREDYRPMGTYCGVDATMIEHERLSNTMACLPHEVPIMMKTYPGSEYRVDESGLAKLVIHNREHKKMEAKRRGYAELG